MILSIGMIVKNEEKYLDRCLTAMQPILDSIDSELIIVDTGSTDKTVEIAKKHTDKVYFFEWINNFAAARNESLKYATGKWFMFVDADEIFEDCSEIIKFFDSGEYKNYNCATFIQRNFTTKDLEPGTFGDFNAPRLSKITPETRFILPVHECFETFNSPIKIINAVANHYGYIHDDDENTIRKKHNRNAPLLLKRLEKEEPTSLLYLQLFEAFYYDDEERAMQFLNDGLELSKKEKSCLVPAFYKKKTTLEFNKKNYEKAIELCDEYINLSDKSIKPYTTGSDGEFTSCKAHMLTLMGRHDEAVKEYIKYFKLFKDFCSGKLDTPDIMMYELHYLCKDKLYLNHREFLYSCMKAKKYNTALEYLKIFPVDKCPDDGYYTYERIRNEVEIAENTGFKNLIPLYNQLPEKFRPYFCRYTRARIFFAENKKEYVKKLLQTDRSESFRLALELIGSYLAGSEDIVEKAVQFGEKFGVAEYPEILYILMAQNKDISPILGAKGFDGSKLSFSCCGDYEGFYDVLENYDISVCSDECMTALADIYATAIIKCEREKRSAVTLLAKYGYIGNRMSVDETSGDNVKGAVIAARLIGTYENRAFKECISHMRSLLQLFPDFKAVINDYQKLIKEQMNAPKAAENSMASMAAIVKRNIAVMINEGNMAGAAATLAELEKLCPDDPDIAELRSKINN